LRSTLSLQWTAGELSDKRLCVYNWSLLWIPEILAA